MKALHLIFKHQQILYIACKTTQNNMDGYPFTKKLDENIQLSMPNAKELIYLFVITFARFEFALKNTPVFLKPQKYNEPGENEYPIAEASWKNFANSLGTKKYFLISDPDVKSAIDYIYNYPPAIQLNVEGRLEWEKSVSTGEPLHEAIYHLQKIRNNLLHGSKFEGDYKPGTRNYELITSGLILMNYLVGLNKEVKDNFDNWVVG